MVHTDNVGERRIVVYGTAPETTDVDELHRFLSSRLPSFMLPSSMMLLSVLPLTNRGKLDKRALPALER